MSRTIRFHLDENSSRAIADGLRRQGIEVTTTPEVGLIGATDDEQLEFAITNGRILSPRIRISSRSIDRASLMTVSSTARWEAEVLARSSEDYSTSGNF